MWICYVCSNNVDRDVLFKFMLETCPWAWWSFCKKHGFMALEVDCSDRSALVLAGRRCTRSFATYNLVLQCAESEAMVSLPQRRMSRSDPLLLQPVTTDDFDDMHDAGQPSTGEMSAAQHSGNIWADDLVEAQSAIIRHLAELRQNVDLAALRNLVRVENRSN